MTLNGAAASAAADAVTGLLAGGALVLEDRDGRELVRLAFGRPAYEKAKGGEALLRPMGSARAVATGTPARFRALTAQGQPVLAGTVGLDGSRADLTLPVGTIVVGADVMILALPYRQPTE